MMSAIRPATFLLRRAVSPSCGNTSSCAVSSLQRHQIHQHNAQLWIGRHSSSSSSTNKQRKTNPRSTGAGAPRKKKPTITNFAPSPTKTTIISSSAPTSYANIRMAPHMMQTTSNKSTAGGIIDHMKNNPLLFAVVVFPTVTMGLLLLVKPTLRPKFMGAGGGGGGSGNDGSASTSGAIGGSYIPNEAPVYESVDTAAVKEEMENVIVEKEKEQIQAEEMVSVTKTTDVGSGFAPLSFFSGRGDNIDCDDVDGNNLAKRAENEGEESSSSMTTTTKEVLDLISAIGIRPHPGGAATA
ncbi:hypothetical protein ACHAWU_002978 [Discostella pseudostelligera]|uniref:Uncharacterized protein n=1 Tax=Discostella pseudostelligera TaxID=259834 RepID=A0ABD3M334_9STRA